MIEMQAFAATCRDGIKNGFEIASQTASEWKGHLVQELKNIPGVIQNNPFIEIGLIVTVNTLFFLAINAMLRRINHDLENQGEPIKLEKRFVKQLFVNVVIPGALIAGFNGLLSLVTPISGWLQVGMVVMAIAARLLINRFSRWEHRSGANRAADQVKKAAEMNQQDQINALQQQVQNLTAERNALQGRVAQLEGDKQNLQVQFNTARDQNVLKDNDIGVLDNRVQDLTNEIEQQEKDYKTLEKDYEELDSDYKQLEAKNEGLKADYQKLEEKYKLATGKETSPPSTPIKSGEKLTRNNSSLMDGLRALVGLEVETPPSSTTSTPLTPITPPAVVAARKEL